VQACEGGRQRVALTPLHGARRRRQAGQEPLRINSAWPAVNEGRANDRATATWQRPGSSAKHGGAVAAIAIAAAGRTWIDPRGCRCRSKESNLPPCRKSLMGQRNASRIRREEKRMSERLWRVTAPAGPSASSKHFAPPTPDSPAETATRASSGQRSGAALPQRTSSTPFRIGRSRRVQRARSPSQDCDVRARARPVLQACARRLRREPCRGHRLLVHNESTFNVVRAARRSTQPGADFPERSTVVMRSPDWPGLPSL